MPTRTDLRHKRWSALLAPLALAAASLVASPVHARTDVCYQGGVNLPNFKLNGTAKLNGTDLLVTPDLNNQLGSAMFIPTFAATSDIHIQLQLQITTSAGGGGGADGMAFVMHRDQRGAAALGDAGGAVGYGGGANKITPSVVVEMDTYTNAGDPNDNHIAVTLDGVAGTHVASYTPPFTMKTVGTPFFVWIDYTAANTLLEVFVSQNATKPAAAQLTTNIDVAARFGNLPFYMGFTGSTGGSRSQHEILSFIASDTAATAAVCCSQDADCAGNPLGGICDTVKHVCGQCTPANVSMCAMANAGCDIGGASNVCIGGCKGNYMSGADGACQLSSAPFCIPSGPTAGSCTACNGNNGSGAMFECPPGAPSCNASGFCGLCNVNADCTALCNTTSKTCVPCDGDNGSAATNACPNATAPICDSLNNCRKCLNDTDCTTGTHAGPYCNTTSGLCSTACSKDSQCGSGMWCNLTGVEGAACEPVVMTGQPLPGTTTCTPDIAQRACQSKACNPTNNQCVECAVDSDCTTTGQVCTNYACTTPPAPPADTFSFAGGGFGCGCTVGGSNHSSASTFGLAACVALLAARAARRRRQDRASAN